LSLSEGEGEGGGGQGGSRGEDGGGTINLFVVSIVGGVIGGVVGGFVTAGVIITASVVIISSVVIASVVGGINGGITLSDVSAEGDLAVLPITPVGPVGGGTVVAGGHGLHPSPAADVCVRVGIRNHSIISLFGVPVSVPVSVDLVAISPFGVGLSVDCDASGLGVLGGDGLPVKLVAGIGVGVLSDKSTDVNARALSAGAVVPVILEHDAIKDGHRSSNISSGVAVNSGSINISLDELAVPSSCVVGIFQAETELNPCVGDVS